MIDVLRAFTVTAYAIAGGASEVIFVTDVERAIAVAAGIPGAVVSAEVDGLPVEGIAISNSPTMVSTARLEGHTLVQRSSAGVQALAVATADEGLLAGSLVVAKATVARILALKPKQVTLVASRGDHHEDIACSAYLEALLRGEPPDLERLLAPLLASPRYAELALGRWPGFPASDLSLSLQADRFDFPLPVVSGSDGNLRVRPQPRP